MKVTGSEIFAHHSAVTGVGVFHQSVVAVIAWLLAGQYAGGTASRCLIEWSSAIRGVWRASLVRTGIAGTSNCVGPFLHGEYWGNVTCQDVARKYCMLRQYGSLTRDRWPGHGGHGKGINTPAQGNIAGDRLAGPRRRRRSRRSDCTFHCCMAHRTLYSRLMPIQDQH